MKLEFSEQAFNDLSKFNGKEALKIKRKFDYLVENYDILKNSKNITSLVNFSNLYRYKISDDIRALFELKDEKITILILKIGYRKEIYKF